MKKYILYLFIMNIVCINTVRSCPFSFSPQDQRPFFEQYQDISTSSQKQEK